MTKDEIHTKIRGIFRESFGDERADAAADDQDVFTTHGRNWENGKLDSIDRVEFVMELEDAFTLEIPDVLMVSITSIDQAVALVHNLVGGAACGSH